MNRPNPQECRDILEHGEMTLLTEVHRDGNMTVLCPCCGGSGEHDTHSGNDPANCAYPCRTCGGTGALNDLPELRTEAVPRKDVRWTGWNSPSGRIRVAPVPTQEGRWRVSGRVPGQSAETTAEELVQMALTIIRELENRGSTEKLDWIREYRRLLPQADLPEAKEAWEQSRSAEAAAAAR